MRVNFGSPNYSYMYSPAFNGTTKICALTDSHQETRKECALLTQIAQAAKVNDNVLALNCGDLFKGIYPRELEVDSYLELKRQNPNLEIVMTLGNNDFGFNEEGFQYLKDTVKKFDENGIQMVCANIFEKSSDKRPDWVKPYTIVKRDGDKIFVTGFCVDNINTDKYGIYPKNPKDVLLELKQNILEEKPDAIIVLNHDWFTNSVELAEFVKKQGIKIDLIIGGHEHDKFKPNKDLNIYYPEAFNGSMYRFDLVIKNGTNRLRNIKSVPNKNLSIDPNLERRLIEYEKQSGLLDGIMPYTMHLPKKYSNPCSLGTFLADAMKGTAKTYVAFFSTGFLMAPMPYRQNSMITDYDLKKTMIAQTPIQKVELTTEELKLVFENATKNRMHKDKGNAKFLQCSKNIKIVGKGNEEDKTYKIVQIFIDKKPLLDDNGNALDPGKKISCAIDSYIASGGQGFGVLKQAKKEDVVKNGSKVKINEVLLDALKAASLKYSEKTNYPKFRLVDLP